jgi:hypothetical protein
MCVCVCVVSNVCVNVSTYASTHTHTHTHTHTQKTKGCPSPHRQNLGEHVDEVGRAPDGQHPPGPHDGELVAVLFCVLGRVVV